MHTPHRSFSQCTTSFFGNWRLGIPRMPFVAYPTCDTEKLMFLRFPLAYSLGNVLGVRTPWLLASPLAPTHRALTFRSSVLGCWLLVVGCWSLVLSGRRLLPSPQSLPDNDLLPHGDEGTRTPDFLLAKQALSLLSYVPSAPSPVGLSRLERLTSRLSGECSNQLSYRPAQADRSPPSP